MTSLSLSLEFKIHENRDILFICYSVPVNITVPDTKKMFNKHSLNGRQPTPVILPGKSHNAEESGGLEFMGSQRVRYD